MQNFDILQGVGRNRLEFSISKNKYFIYFRVFIILKVRNPAAVEDEKIGNDSEKAWRNFKRKNESLISTLFYGLQKSTVSCVKCNEKSATFEPFSNLSLIIPETRDISLEVK